MRLFVYILSAVSAAIPTHLGTADVDQYGFPRLASIRGPAENREQVPGWLLNEFDRGAPHLVDVIFDPSIGFHIMGRRDLRIAYRAEGGVGQVFQAYERVHNLLDHVSHPVYFSLDAWCVIYARNDARGLLIGSTDSILRHNDLINFAQTARLVKTCFDIVFSLPVRPAAPMTYRRMVFNLLNGLVDVRLLVGDDVETNLWGTRLLDVPGVVPADRFKVAMNIMLVMLHGGWSVVRYEGEPTDALVQRAFFQEEISPQPLQVGPDQQISFRPLREVLKGAYADQSDEDIQSAFGSYLHHLRDELNNPGEYQVGSVRSLDDHIREYLGTQFLLK